MKKDKYILLLMYDLPSSSAENRANYRKLVSLLHKTGFYSMQGSIYIKPLSDKSKASTIISAIEKISPVGSHVRAIVLTYNAFSEMVSVAGEDTWGERIVKAQKSVLTF